MRNICLLLLLLVCVDSSFSQKISPRRLRKHRARVYESRNKGTVILSLDTIFNKGVPYAILRKKKQLPYNDYAIFSLGNQPLISIRSGIGVKDRTQYYGFYFLESKKRAEPEYFGFHIEKAVVKFDLVKGEEINPYGEMDFLKKYPPQYSDPYYVKYVDENIVSTPDIYETVKRDRGKQVYISEGKIQQDFKVIGSYKREEDVLRFYLPDHIMVAEANLKEPGSDTWVVTTLKDKKNSNVHSSDADPLRDLVQFLLDKGYL